jgi:hypothetical protein
MADPKKLLGGLGKVRERLLSGDELTAAQRADAGRKAAELIKAQEQVKASEALGQLMEKGMKRTTTTQADRTRVGGGNIGGASFPAISQADPAYAGKVWGVMDEGTAARLKNLTDPDTAWTTMLGSANQLKTNPIVFDKLKRQFIASMKQGNLSPELEAKINHNLALTFGEGASIRDPKIWSQADTFDKRAALADLMMGQGIAPKKGGLALGGEKSGKGVIFKPTDTLKRETEPSLLHTEHGGDIPTFAAGPRLFKLEKESEYRPDLHPGFPTLLRGEDLGFSMKPTPTEVYLPDWHKKFKKNNPERYPPFKTEKQGGPGYYDLALGVKGEGLPSQDLNDEYIRHLLREGFKKGGAVSIEEADQRLKEAIQKRMAKGGRVNIEESDAKLKAAIQARMGMAQGGEVGFKKIEFMDKGGKVGKLAQGVASVGKRLLADAPVESPAAKQMRLNMMPTARIGLEAPGILIPSKMNNVREAVRNMKGNYGARRVERAADEIPNLEKMYQEDALKEAFTGDNASAMITLSPAEFERYAAELTKRSSVGPKMAELAKQGDIDKMTVPTDEYIKHLQRLQGGFDDVPYLNLFKDEVGIPANPKITGHEGRHRSRALAESGAPSSLVKINPRGDLREGLPRRTQEDFIEALKEELELSNRLVVPESEPYFRRPDVKFPDVYAEGGGAFKKIQFMSDGGVLHMADAGKVVRGMAQVGKRLLQDLPVAPKVKPPSDNVANVRQANFQYPKTVGNQTVGIDKLSGGVRMSDPNEVKRVKALADQIASPEGYISRIIVDHNNNVIEGQHRLEALRQLGVKDVPVFKIEDLADTMPVSKMEEAMREVGGIRSDHVNQLMQHALDAISEGGIEGARQLNYGGFQKHYDAALNAITSDVKKADGGSVFKKLQFMDKGGITTSAGSFSPEELGVTADDLRLIDDKTLQLMKKNAPATYDWVKQNIKDEASQLKTPRGVKDFGLRVGAQYAGAIPDLINLGLYGIDLAADTNLSSEKPWFGSQQYLEGMEKAGMLGESEFPISETVAGILAPAGLIRRGIKKGAQLYKGKKPEAPKKRRGGLAAMAR